MAGDWIKMGKDLLTHPKVVRMSSALRADKLRTVGGLFAVWCLFDTHSVDGQLSGYTKETIDDEIRFPGFSEAMEAVDWLETDEEGAYLPDFEEHNGQSAKRRAQESERKRTERKASASDADKKRTREEKRREEKSNTNSSLRSESDGAKTRATKKCPADFQITDEMKSWAQAEHPSVDLQLQTASFRDHTFATAKTDWVGTWRNWIRKSAGFGGTSPRTSQPMRPPSPAELRLFHSSPSVMDKETLARCRAYTGEKPKTEIIEMEPSNANAIALG